MTDGKSVAFFTFRKSDSDWDEMYAAAKGKPSEKILKEFYSALKREGIDISSPVKALTDAFPEAVKVTGDEIAGSAHRNNNVQLFMAGKAKVMVVTQAAGGTGLSLHDKLGDFPRVQINLTSPYTAMQMEQVAGRTFRMGSQSHAEMYWMFNDTPLEQKYARRTMTRMKEMGALVTGDEALANDADMLEFIFADSEAFNNYLEREVFASQAALDLTKHLTPPWERAGYAPEYAPGFQNQAVAPVAEAAPAMTDAERLAQHEALLAYRDREASEAGRTGRMRSAIELAQAEIPGLRLSDAEEASRIIKMRDTGQLRPGEWEAYVADLWRSNKIGIRERDAFLAKFPDLASPPPPAVAAVEAALTAPAVSPPAPTGIIGRETIAYGADPNRVYNFRYKVVSLDDLIPSHTDSLNPHPDYTIKELQERLRDNAASREQINEIVARFTPPGYLDEFKTLDRGTMIIGPDNLVESGNGRTLALRKIREQAPEKWQTYQDALPEYAARNGITPEQLANVKDPVLVRERLTPLDAQQRVAFAAEANDRTTMDRSSVEKAITDANRFNVDSLAVLEVNPDQSIDQALLAPRNRSVIQSFIGSLPSNEHNTVIDATGNLSPVGLQRIKQAMLAYTYNGAAAKRLAETFINSLDSGIKHIQNGVYASLPRMAQAESLIRAGLRPAEMSVTDDLAIAIDKLAYLRETGMRVDDFLAQVSMFGKELNPFQEDLLEHLDSISRNPKKVREFIDGYAQSIIDAENTQQMRFAKEDLLGQAKAYESPEEMGLFDGTLGDAGALPPASAVFGSKGAGLARDARDPFGVGAAEPPAAAPVAPTTIVAAKAKPGWTQADYVRAGDKSLDQLERDVIPNLMGLERRAYIQNWLDHAEKIVNSTRTDSAEWIVKWNRNVRMWGDALEITPPRDLGANVTGNVGPLSNVVNPASQVKVAFANLRDQMTQPARPVPPATAPQIAVLKDLANTQYIPAMVREKAGVASLATKQRNFALGDYTAKRNIHEWLSFLYPYSYWYTFTYKNWAERLAKHPAYLSNYARYKAMLHEENQKRYRAEVGDPNATMPPDWENQIQVTIAGNPLHVNLERTLMPLNALVESFSSPAKEQAPGGNLVKTLGDWGPSIWTPYIWAYAAWLNSQGHTEAANELVSYLAPASQPIKSATALYKELGGPGGAAIPGGGFTPEQLFNPQVKGGSIWEKRRIGKYLADMVDSGEVTVEEAQDAAYKQTGPIWEKAMQAETVARAPGNLAAFAFGQGFKARTNAEMLINQAYAEKAKLPKYGEPGYQEAKAKFDALYPWYSLYWASREQDPQSRLASYADMIFKRLPVGKGYYGTLTAAGITEEMYRRFQDNKEQAWSVDDLAQTFAGWQPWEIKQFQAGIEQLGAQLKAPTAAEQATRQQYYTDMDAAAGRGRSSRRHG